MRSNISEIFYFYKVFNVSRFYMEAFISSKFILERTILCSPSI